MNNNLLNLNEVLSIMVNNYANRPSQSNLEYVVNSQGKKVKNLAYNPTRKSNLNTARTIVTPTTTIQKHYPQLQQLNTLLYGLHPDQVKSTREDYAQALNHTTACSNHYLTDIEKEENIEVSNYLFYARGILSEAPTTLSDRARKIRQEKLEIIYDNIYPVQGVIWKGVPTKQYKDTEYDGFKDYFSKPKQLDNYVEKNIDTIVKDNKWSSYSMSPGVALSFSYGLKRSMDRYGLSKASHMIDEGIYDGVLIAQVNPEGYSFHYPDKDKNITVDNDNNEYEVLLPPQENTIIDIIPTDKSPVRKPIIIVK